MGSKKQMLNFNTVKVTQITVRDYATNKSEN